LNRIEQFKTLSAQRDALLAKGDAITSEELQTAAGLNEQLKGIKAEIEAMNALKGASADLSGFLKDPVLQVPVTPNVIMGATGEAKTVEIGFDKKLGYVFDDDDYGPKEKHRKSTQTKEYGRAMLEYLRKGERADSAVFKALAEGTDSAGGFWVPEQWIDQMIMKTAAPTRVGGLVTRINATRDAILLPSAPYSTDDIYTSAVRFTATGEIPASSTAHLATDPGIGQTRVDVMTWMGSLPLYNDFIEDSPVAAMQFVMGEFAMAKNALEDDQILNGTGVGARPHGIFKNPGGTNEPAVVLSSTNNLLDANQIRGMPMDLPEQYLGGAVWVMNRAGSGKHIAQMVDGSNRYLFEIGQNFSNITEPLPDRLVGYPVVWSAFCANEGDGAFPACFGNLASAYVLASRVDMSIQVLNEVNALTNQKVILARLRFGGKVWRPWAIKVAKSDAS